MAYVAEEAVWKEGVYQLETHDPVLGGPNGVSNKNIKDLACRTLWLRRRVDEILEYNGNNDDTISDIYNTLLGIQGNLAYIFGLIGNIEDYLNDLNTLRDLRTQLESDIASGEKITLPEGAKYYVGSHSLNVFWQGVKCAEGYQFEEGEADENGQCDYITTLFKMRSGGLLQFWITGYSTQIIDGSGSDMSGWGDELLKRILAIEASIDAIEKQLVMQDASEIFEDTLEEK